PAPIGSLRRERPIEQIRRDRLIVVAHRGALEPLPHAGLEAVLLHQPNDALAADGLVVLLEQIPVNPRTAVPALARGERRPDEHFQVAILFRTRRLRSLPPGVEAAARHAQTATQQIERMMRLLRRDEPEFHRRSFAKKAAAFFKISRSSRRIRFSFRRRASSSRSPPAPPTFP